MEEVDLEPNPMDKAGIFSKTTFWWLLPLFKKGYKGPLEKEDLFQLRKQQSAKILGDLLSNNWDKEISRAKVIGRNPSFARALFLTFGLRFCLWGIASGFDRCFFRLLQALFLGGLIKYFNNNDPLFSSDCIGWLLATGIVLCAVSRSILIFTLEWDLFNLGMETRVATCNLLYRKALRLSSTALSQTTVGQMVNLLSNDVNRFDLCIVWFHSLWNAPLQIILITAILWQLLGPSCFVAVIFSCINVPLQGFMSKVYRQLCLATADLTDERIGTTNEVMSIIRFIKIYCWEGFFRPVVEEFRRREVNKLLKTNYYISFNWALYFVCGKIVIFFTFLVYILLGNDITAEKVFITMILIGYSNNTMTHLFPLAITQLTGALISCDRIQKFLELEEKDKSVYIEKLDSQPMSNVCSIVVKDMSARWNPASGSDDITGVSFSAKAGQLIAIVGPVGSGKSSLLQSLIGELPIKTGSIKIIGKMAFVSQEPWLFPGSIRHNILFGQPFQIRKYRKVIKECALEKDLELLPDKDQTIVGEKGVSLSGGQKARICLARAVYFDADIYLLDDPLSAVDAHVGGHLFRQCISKFLSKKVCILVTHQLQYLKTANQILVLQNGVVQSIGIPCSLTKQGININGLLGCTKVEKNCEDVLTELPRKRTNSCWEMPDESILCSKLTRFRRDSQAWQSLIGAKEQVDESFGEGIIEISSGAVAGRRMSLMEDYELEEIMEVEKPEKEEINFSENLDKSIYVNFFKAGGGIFFLIALAAMFFVKHILFVGVDYWLAYWLRHEREFVRTMQNVRLNEKNITFENVTLLEPIIPYERKLYLYIYSGLVAALIIATYIQSVLYARLCAASSEKLHRKMFSAILKTDISFFDKHSLGQILNRFSNDLGKIDTLLPTSMYNFIMCGLCSAGILGVIVSINYWIMVHIVIILTILWFLLTFYLPSIREIRRLEAVMRNPVFSHLSSSMQGLATIRSFGAQNQLIKEFENHQDMHTRVWFLILATTVCLGVWLDIIIITIIAVTTFSFFGMKGEVSGNEVGLSISTVLMLVLFLTMSVRQYVEVENHMQATERVIKYTKLESENSKDERKETKKSAWPSAGNLSFQNVYLYYDKNEPPVLKNVTFNIKGGQKIGIVGRTGAGKSTILTCLLRLTQPQGKISIEDVNTDSISLKDLRESISVIPQDPILFKGTVRQNLDPFSNYSDNDIWKVLEQVELNHLFSKQPNGLNLLVTQGGDNFSIGQRQLICLARAILKHNKILVMDEATANMDQETDSKIQKIIRETFVDCTVLTIAHRIQSIIDSDKVIVMDAGEVKEFSSPHELLLDRRSLFSELVRGTDPDHERLLRKAAKEVYYSRLASCEQKEEVCRQSC